MRTRPVLLYDGDCGFCTSCVKLLGRWVRPRAETTAWQFADLPALGVTRERADREVLWVTPNGHVYGGASTVAKVLLSGRGPWPVLGGALLLPGVRWVAGRCYELVSANRHRLPGGTPACAARASAGPAAGKDAPDESSGGTGGRGGGGEVR
ncbi:thiol-disulfide oxidoreductase DCC family protein [Streptomyces sp. NPDC059740]|uniref:thiol-disulfide oxidoreductase DCC family protein n=1 Tax=Streptomyces sp. NPDC059740 TaxID=3346926 RepID=UPI003658849D